MKNANDIAQVQVWDPLLRIFHWSLAAAFFVAYFTGDELEQVHEFVGYLILGLIAFRVIWGFVGPHHARFTSFVRGPAAVLSYLRSLLSSRPVHFLGHNPAGGWMTIALLLILVATCWSGIESIAAEGRGPLAAISTNAIQTAHANGEGRARVDEREGDEFWEEVHELLAEVCLALVLIHIVGVVLSSVLHRENLVRAMVTGRKRLPPRQN